MTGKIAFIVFIAVFVAGTFAARKCRTSMDCSDKSGRSVCWSKSCHKNIPCNKDNDCYFYAAADVAEGLPHSLCFEDPDSNRRLPEGYGTCMMAKMVGDKYRLLEGGRPNAVLSPGSKYEPDVGPLAFLSTDVQ